MESKGWLVVGMSFYLFCDGKMKKERSGRGKRDDEVFGFFVMGGEKE